MEWNSTNYDCEYVSLDSTPNIGGISAVAILLIFFSVLGNGLVIIAVYKTESLQSPTIFFLTSLAVSDLLTGLLVVPAWCARLLLNFRKGYHPLSITTEFLTFLTMTTSTYSLCAVTLDRYLAIIHTLTYNVMVTTRRSFRLICLVWSLSCLPGVFRAIFSDQMGLRLVYICSIAAIVVIPFAFITVCYIRIFIVARTQARRVATENRSVSPEALKNTKAAKTVAIVILVFAVCWIPLLVFCGLEFLHVSSQSVCDDLRSRFRFAAISAVLAFSSSVWNPLIYTLRYKKFREAFKRLICQRINLNVRLFHYTQG